MMRRITLLSVAATGALLLSACAANEIGLVDESGLRGFVVGGGASSQQSAQEAWVAGFQTSNPGVTVEYDPAGSGAGRDMFLAGGAHFAGSDRAFTREELAASTAKGCTPGSAIVEIPVYISPIAVVFTLEGIDRLDLDAATIAAIFAGDVTRWNDDAIASQNPGVDLPDLEISPVHRSDDSGVTENFTEYLHEAAPHAWPFEPDGEWPTGGGESAQGNSGVVDSVTNGRGTIGYVEASRAAGLGLVAVKVGAEYVPYSAAAAAAVVDASTLEVGRAPTDLAITIDRATEASGVYPIVLVSYFIACEQYPDAAVAELVRAYFSYVISPDAQARAADWAGSAPISRALFERASAAVERIR